METTWDVVLLVAKFVFIGLVYLLLIGVVITVRREMQQHVGAVDQSPTAAPGRLKVIQGGSDTRLRPGHVLVLESQATLGADSANGIVLYDRFVSGRHARLRWDGTQWLITDLGSTNGTFVNGRSCPPRREIRVPVGATIQLGDVVLQLLD